MFKRVLIANRGEIAVRLSRAVAECGASSVAVFSSDDVQALHTVAADEAVALEGRGVGPYLDIDQIVGAARRAGCDALHPGYGFLSENAELARRCAEEGIVFIGPDAQTLELFGDKGKARSFAHELGVPIAVGSSTGDGVDGALKLLSSLPEGSSVMLKAVAGGGGRGMRVVRKADELPGAFERASAEALAAFGNGAVYAERLVERARHIEIQVIGDGAEVSHLGERECSLQRRHQKLVEIAPSPSLTSQERDRIAAAAVTMARNVGYRGLGTFEFLLDLDSRDLGQGRDFVFMEVNPRIQVEHTITEMVTGVDLAVAQIQVATGMALEEIGLTQRTISKPRGYAMQVRINMETVGKDGEPRPTGGRISVFEPPSGPGIRVDSMGYAGYVTSPSFDSLLAKLIVHHSASDYEGLVRKAERALQEFRIEGLETNIAFQMALLADSAVRANNVDTRFIEAHVAKIVRAASVPVPTRYFAGALPDSGEDDTSTVMLPAGTVPASAGMLGTVVSLLTEEDAVVAAGQPIVIVEAMKMEHVIAAPETGRVAAVLVALGETVDADTPLVAIHPGAVDQNDVTFEPEKIDLDAVRPDLELLQERLSNTLDQARPQAVAKRHATGHRTARENITDLVDDGSLIEYGQLAIAARRARLPYDELVKTTPADGIITGLASINREKFGPDQSRVAVLSYDWTVFAGTQGVVGHKKHDRIFKVAKDLEVPLVFITEGGGGRPGDTEFVGPAGLDIMSFGYLAELSGLVPLIGVTNRYCFAGNAALLSMCDVIIATEGSNIGMGGPAMIEGGGLGKVEPNEIGPSDVQSRNGVIDILVPDEAAAIEATKKYLAFFQGPIDEWECADQRMLRHLIPTDRLRSYDVRAVIEAIADTGSVLELRREFGIGMITALARVEGRTVGITANNSRHLGGAVDADAADKMARFMQLCDAFDVPIVHLLDTPGFMVGPDAEEQAQVRHFGRVFVTGANLSVPTFAFVLRKGYGLGALGSAGGGFHTPTYMAAWSTGEFGGMGLEGHVRISFAKELAAIEDEDAREAEYQRLVDDLYARGSAIGMAEDFEIDAVIDPMETRRWIIAGLDSAPRAERHGKRRPNIDTW